MEGRIFLFVSQLLNGSLEEFQRAVTHRPLKVLSLPRITTDRVRYVQRSSACVQVKAIMAR